MLRLEKSLSNMIKYCKSCLLPNTKPYIRFNSSNVCSACILHFSKKSNKRINIDWKKKKKGIFIAFKKN